MMCILNRVVIIYLLCGQFQRLASKIVFSKVQLALKTLTCAVDQANEYIVQLIDSHTSLS